MRFNEQGYLERKRKTGRNPAAKTEWSDKFLIKYGKENQVMLTVNGTTFTIDKKYVGKWVKIKIEEIGLEEDKKQ